jgi:transcriptional regulator with XRE-family HTH domain
VSAFAELLYQLVEERVGSLNEFARLVDYPQPTISQIRAGSRPVPLKHIARWATVLKIPENSPEWERFRDLASLTHLPDDEARERIERVLFKWDDLKVRHEALRRQVDELLQQTPRNRTPPTA